MSTSKYYSEKHRPQFHFSPEENWMNDPNGMVYYEGEYHLFYQHYPDSSVWGPMHWGHAVSADLVHWEHLPIALYPDELGYIFSGSAVIDWKNTSGFGDGVTPPMIAIFTYHNSEREKAGADDYQTQGIAYSTDKGRTWTKYKGNPVIPNPGVRDFRDPKVFWHLESEKWVMTVAALDRVQFYGSENLKDWVFLSEFGADIGSHDGVWECPDLFPIIDEKGDTKWVLLLNMNPGNPNGGSGLQYFIGGFDGNKFTVGPKFKELLSNIPAYSPEGIVFENFENGYKNWTAVGSAFEKSPKTPRNEMSISGYDGEKYAHSYGNGDEATGSLTSQEFVIEKDAINFLIGGGNHRGRTLISLLVEGKTVREAEGKNKEMLEWRGWDVSSFKGQKGQIRIIDNSAGPWGHINIDQITFADNVAYGERTGSVWLDAGRDNYAGVTWSDVPESDGRRLFIGWMSNWAYAQTVPTNKWRSACTVPWSLSIQHINGIPRLIGQPIHELSKIRNHKLEQEGNEIDIHDGLVEIELDVSAEEDFTLRLENGLGEGVDFKYLKELNQFVFVRTNPGGVNFSSDFLGNQKTNRISASSNMTVKAYVDHSSIEVFIDGGTNIFSNIFFPTKPYDRLILKGSIKQKNIYKLNRIWN
ncbi:MAG: glycoside hydrolase family 32 protein [Saprospiraceae bacterium]|nr:glycoside hydrolase family 32 protein [Saprospiraceae bacterium]